MAVVRARSAPPYPLITAIVLCVLFAGAAGFMYYLWDKGNADAQSTEKTLAQLGTSSDINSARAGSSGNTPLLRQLVTQNKDLKQLVMGTDTASVDDILHDPVIVSAKDKHLSLMAAIKALTDQRDELTSNLAAAEARAKSASDSNGAAQQRVKNLTDSYEKTISDLQNQLKDAQDKIAAANSERDQAVADGLTKAQKAQDDLDAAKREMLLQVQDLQATITRQQSQLKDLENVVAVLRHGGTTTAVGEPDGTVQHVNAAAGEVYISLTSADHIKPGMTFTVYDPRLGVRYGTDEEAKGNGTLEVTDVRADSSVCRITSTTPNHAIQQGDLISNLVYHQDKNRKFHFVVFGDFDLDGDGIATAAERDRLVSMIKSWGGQIDNDVTSQTDYIVMGARPAPPAIVEDKSDATATAPGSIADQRDKEDTRYDQIITEGKDLGIPVLNANRFLSLIGYYNTTIVRY